MSLIETQQQLKQQGIYVLHMARKPSTVPFVIVGLPSSVLEIPLWRINLASEVLRDILEDPGFSNVSRALINLMNNQWWKFIRPYNWKKLTHFLKPNKIYDFNFRILNWTIIALLWSYQKLIANINNSIRKILFCTIRWTTEVPLRKSALYNERLSSMSTDLPISILSNLISQITKSIAWWFSSSKI